jgi:hypothetical protein
MKNWTALLLVTCLSFPVSAQETNLSQLPGFINFASLSEVYGEPRVMINISGFLLKFMAMASKDDPQASEVMRNLQAVRVNVYNTAGIMTPALEQIANVKAMLNKDGWQPVVQVTEDSEEVQIFMKGNEAGMQGLTVMTVDAKEAVFINILGEIDPSQVSSIMNRINVNLDGDSNSDAKD